MDYTQDHDRATLLQSYTPIFTMIAALEVSREYGEPRELLQKTKQLFETIRDHSRQEGRNPDWVADTQYAVAAFVDESVGRSDWHGKHEWNQFPLSAQMGMEPNAGVVFFQKLNAWMQQPDPPTEVLEVFYVCLGLGFTGQFFSREGELNKIKRQILDAISRRKDPVSILSPGARISGDTVRADSDTFPWPWFGSIAIGFLLVLFVLFKFLSGREINNLVEALTGGS